MPGLLGGMHEHTMYSREKVNFIIDGAQVGRNTALTLASQNGHANVVTALAAAGEDLNALNAVSGCKQLSFVLHVLVTAVLISNSSIN